MAQVKPLKAHLVGSDHRLVPHTDGRREQRDLRAGKSLSAFPRQGQVAVGVGGGVTCVPAIGSGTLQPGTALKVTT